MPQPPPNKFKLTDATASTLPVPATGQVFYWCNKQPGFCLRVTANGARAWVAQGRVNGKTCRVTLGRLEQLNTESARGHAKAALTLMFQKISPVERKRQVKMQSETLLRCLRNIFRHDGPRLEHYVKSTTISSILTSIVPTGAVSP